MQTTWRIISTDYKRVIRDPFLIFMVVAPFIMAIALRFALPYLNELLGPSIGLVQYYPALIAFVGLTPTLYLGATLALQIVEEKESRVITAVCVTPTPPSLYFGVRLAFYTLLAFLIVGVVQMEIGLLNMSLSAMWLVALSASLQAPILGLIVASFASNQLEGMIAIKVTSFLVVAAALMFFVPSPWHYFCAILPSYWPIYAFYIAAEQGTSALFFTYICIGILAQSATVYALYRMFEKRAK